MTWNKIRLLVLTRVEAAEELGVAPPTLDKYRKRGILVPIASASGRVIAYSKEDIRKFKAKQSAAAWARNSGNEYCIAGRPSIITFPESGS